MRVNLVALAFVRQEINEFSGWTILQRQLFQSWTYDGLTMPYSGQRHNDAVGHLTDLDACCGWSSFIVNDNGRDDATAAVARSTSNGWLALVDGRQNLSQRGAARAVARLCSKQTAQVAKLF